MPLNYIEKFRQRRQLSAGHLNEVTEYINNQKPFDYTYTAPRYSVQEANSSLYARIISHNKNRHGWEEVEFSPATNNWSTLSGGLSGATDNDPAYLVGSGSDSNWGQFIPKGVVVQLFQVGEHKVIRVFAPILCSIVSVKGDYLICQRPGNEDEDEEFDVAKPPLLRSGETSRVELAGSAVIEYEDVEHKMIRKATFGQVVEKQYVLPAYRAGDTVYAGPPGGGLSGVNNEAGDQIYFTEMNLDGRYWTAKDEPTTP